MGNKKLKFRFRYCFLISVLTIFIQILSSCGSNLVISSSRCLSKDTVDLNRVHFNDEWLTEFEEEQVKNQSTINKQDVQKFKLNARTHALFGSHLPKSYNFKICPFLNNNLRANDSTNDSIRELNITTYYSFKDVILGVVPIYSPRSIEINGLYLKDIH
ncbi:MAG: hypothetical protein HQK49_20225 [Oligoflexia bacterium]|nr:hypothetical protein [Oligoflexia bacterium]